MVKLDPDGILGKSENNSVMSDGSYDIESLKAAENAVTKNDVDTSGMVDVDPLYIPVIANREVVRTEEYEARMVIVEYDNMDNIIGVELL